MGVRLIVVGAQWGDEGKGKVVDLLAEKFDVVARYQGGNNAGHTVRVNGVERVFHLLPSAILHPGKICVLGNGMVIDPKAFNDEIGEINCDGRLFVSDRAHLIMPWHKELERARSCYGKDGIGTTQRGIGPAYVSKSARTGYRICDVAGQFGDLWARLRKDLQEANEELLDHNVGPLPGTCLNDFHGEVQQLKPFVADTSLLINKAIRKGKSVLFEGAQGTMLDIDHGTYPYVTSSNTAAGGACTGTGVAPTLITGTIGVVKAYTTRVGGGPFPTELDDHTGAHLQKRGHEVGASTGRTRRCGWFDAVVVRHSVMLNNLDALALTKLDVLDDLPEIKVCVGYLLDGSESCQIPARTEDLARCQPVWQTVPGWLTSTRGITHFSKLPYQAQKYIRLIEELCDVPVKIVSTGPERNETIVRRNVEPFGWM